MNKLIIGLQVNGWSEKLCGKALDERRNDIIYCAKNAQEAIGLLNSKISDYKIRKFTHSAIKTKLNFLGKGSEGFVFTDKQNVYKLIDKSEQSLELYWMLLSLSETLQSEIKISAFPNFEVFYMDKYVLIKYKYEVTSEFGENTNVHIDKFINLLKQFRQIKWTLSDFKLKNIRITE